MAREGRIQGLRDTEILFDEIWLAGEQSLL
jgi:hypothetical protein